MLLAVLYTGQPVYRDKLQFVGVSLLDFTGQSAAYNYNSALPLDVSFVCQKSASHAANIVSN